ncbi:hypothetical protein T190_17105 [Sinorhizobium meliloti CCBAU 01290]|nr:hypothetical protein T190_17105 [Sinorhizobium meliloti CCBAU 01290]
MQVGVLNLLDQARNVEIINGAGCIVNAVRKPLVAPVD